MSLRLLIRQSQEFCCKSLKKLNTYYVNNSVLKSTQISVKQMTLSNICRQDVLKMPGNCLAETGQNQELIERRADEKMMWKSRTQEELKCAVAECFIFFLSGKTAQRGPRPPHFFMFLDHTQWHTRVSRTPLDERIDPTQRSLPDITQQSHETHNNHTRHTTMPPARFEPAIPASDRLQTLVWNRSATGIGGDYSSFHFNCFRVQIFVSVYWLTTFLFYIFSCSESNSKTSSAPRLHRSNTSEHATARGRPPSRYNQLGV
jgi:hypothetical protein